MDASKMKKLQARLPELPTTGAPAIEAAEAAAAAKKPPAVIVTSEVVERAQIEHKRKDGRSLRASGRNVSFGTKVSPAFDTAIRDYAQEHGQMICVVLEDGLSALQKLSEAAKERGMQSLELLDRLLANSKKRAVSQHSVTEQTT
jgi:hypothetical protein